MSYKYLLQKQYCEETNNPLFAPEKRCCNCGKDIWEKITIKDAATSLITGCPFCNFSFCE